MPAWDFSRVDWESRIEAGLSLMPELPLDHDAAEKAVGYFDNLRLPDVLGHPRFAEAGADWFREIVGAVFGSLVGQDRMVREVFALVPKKNSKSCCAGHHDRDAFRVYDHARRLDRRYRL
jgi:phage terminase large subunit-like protein